MPITYLLAYHKAIAEWVNPDSPKNLSQVVKLWAGKATPVVNKSFE